MSQSLAGLRPALLLRLQFIECLLANYGHINRGTIMDFFAMSAPQATFDLRRYQELAPGNLYYDLRAKAYLRSAGFARLWPVDGAAAADT